MALMKTGGSRGKVSGDGLLLWPTPASGIESEIDSIFIVEIIYAYPVAAATSFSAGR
jgi:hypothetical protein